MTKIIYNLLKGTLILKEAGIKLKAGEGVEVSSITREMKESAKRKLIKIGDKTGPAPVGVTTDKREWMVDYSDEAEGEITVHDLSTGRKLTARIEEKKGEQHYKLENIGTVNGQKYFTTQLAKDHFDGLE